ncbi:MAG: hypothetical protein ABSG96_05730 [Terracidiphilus sp.]|jgi:hypothetical protein
MASENLEYVAGHCKYYQDEIENTIRLMKIEGGTLDDCIAELNILADFIYAQADALRDAWPNLLKDTVCEQWEQRQSENRTSGVPMRNSDD